MTLKLSDWADIAGIVSGVAVVITLVFLVIGIRENTAVTRASMYERSADRLIDLRNQLLNDPEMLRLFQAYVDRRPEGIEGVDRIRLRQLVANISRHLRDVGTPHDGRVHRVRQGELRDARCRPVMVQRQESNRTPSSPSP